MVAGVLECSVIYVENGIYEFTCVLLVCIETSKDSVGSEGNKRGFMANAILQLP
jgi:hypothetical protein